MNAVIKPLCVAGTSPRTERSQQRNGGVLVAHGGEGQPVSRRTTDLEAYAGSNQLLVPVPHTLSLRCTERRGNVREAYARGAPVDGCARSTRAVRVGPRRTEGRQPVKWTRPSRDME